MSNIDYDEQYKNKAEDFEKFKVNVNNSRQ